MPTAFDASKPPFDRLTPAEVATLREAIDVGYFRPGETIVEAGSEVESLFVLIKGSVEERSGNELFELLGPDDVFDSRALLQGTASHRFVAHEETLCYLLPRPVALSLIEGNPRFGVHFFRDISHKLGALAEEEESRTTGALMRARVSELPLQPAEFIDADDTIETAGRVMQRINSNTLFVRDGDRTGIVTGMNLSKAVVLRGVPITGPVRPVAHYDVVGVRRNDFVSSALLLMTKHNKRRLAVRDGDSYVGVLEDIGLLSFIAGDLQIVAGRIEHAASPADLSDKVAQIAAQVRVLRRQGVNIDVIAQIASDLYGRLLAKLFELLAPDSLRRHSCLIVMGSEGRGEQTLATDQDNGLILADADSSPPPAVLAQFRAAFSGSLQQFGFPPCPGGVMVQNPLWSRTLDEYMADFRRWVALPEAAAHLNVAIFYDADAVAGDTALLQRAKATLIDVVRDQRAYLSHFAKAIEEFTTPIGLFNNLVTSGDALDLKKGGLFPIVHGVRSLALEAGLTDTGTAARIGRLAGGALTQEFAHELTDAFHVLMRLRLDAQLHGADGGLVYPAQMSGMDRELLRDALRIVKRFREIVRHRFNLAMF